MRSTYASKRIIQKGPESFYSVSYVAEVPSLSCQLLTVCTKILTQEQSYFQILCMNKNRDINSFSANKIKGQLSALHTTYLMKLKC